MATLPSDFNSIFGSTATGGLTPIPSVDYAKGWEYVGANPPTKNDFSYLQNTSDQKAKWLYDYLVLSSNAASRKVGAVSGSIPDMSFFSSVVGTNGYQKLPSGLIIQWGQNSMPAPGSSNSVTYPIAFPSAVYAVLITTNATGGATTGIAPSSTNVVTTTGFGWVRFAGADYSSYGVGYWMAIGR